MLQLCTAPERHWGWLLRHMKGESPYEIAKADGVSAPGVRVALVKLGCRFPLPQMLPELPRRALKAYANQKAAAKYRGVRWEFTIESWWRVWLASGKWEHRGIAGDDFVMGRYQDTGPYAEWNVRIIQVRENVKEARELQHRAVLARRTQEYKRAA